MLDKFRKTAITWDKANRKVYEPLRVSAGDNKGRKLSVQVVNGGVIENLSGAILSLYWETKDKAHKGLDAFAAVDASKGEFEIYYTTGMLSNEGTLNAHLVLVDASGRIVSEPFTINVFKGIDDDAIQSSDSFTALTEALAQVGNINNKADRAELLELESTFEQNKLSLEQQLAHKASLSYFYTPRKQDSLSDSYMTNLNANDIYNLYDGLISANEKYITNSTLGMDASGLYAFKRYIFSPEEPEYTIILGANMHGDGTRGDPKDVAVALFNFLREVTENWRTDEALYFLRWKVRFVVHPVENPWGFNHNKRQNVNGVDLNRNFDYMWEQYPVSEPFTHNHKGTAPFSEKESQYVRDTLHEFSDAIAYYSFHAWANASNYKLIYVGNQVSHVTDMAVNLAGFLNHKYQSPPLLLETERDYGVSPMSWQYAKNVLGMDGANPEFVVRTTDMPPRTSDMVTKMVEWWGNIIYLTAKERRNALLNVEVLESEHTHLWVKHGSGNLGPITFQTIGEVGISTVVENPKLNYEFIPEQDCSVKVTMRINVKNDTEGSSSAISPVLYQYGNIDFNESSIVKIQNRWEAFWDGSQRQPLTLQAVIPVKKEYGKVHIGLGGYTSAGVIQLYRYSCLIEVVPEVKNSDYQGLYMDGQNGWSNNLN